jgi:uncharacterized membrane protein YdbT with pleckstrin-like domain
MKSWWKQRSGPVKVLLVLATLLVLQLILVVVTPSLSQRWDTAHHVPAGEGWGTFSLLVGQLSLCVFNVVAMILTCLIWLIITLIRRRTVAEKTNV